MAKRLYFIAKPSYQGLIVEKTIEFEYFRGESQKQKERSIESMHHAIRAFETGGKILDVSKNSDVPLGRKLSGVNLLFETDKGSYPVLNIFQSAKVFEGGGPYEDLLAVDAALVSKDRRLKESGRLLGFHYDGEPYSLTPRHYFFDWIYVNALNQHKELHEEILSYDMITDIDYNMNSMFASSARALAYFISLYRAERLEDAVSSKESFLEIYKMVF